MALKKSVTVLNLRRVLKMSWPKKSYEIVEPDYFSTPKMLRGDDDNDMAGDLLQTVAEMTSCPSRRLTRSTSMTQSFRGAVGSIKQKLKRSNTKRRLKLDAETECDTVPTLRKTSRINTQYMSASSINHATKKTLTHQASEPRVFHLETPARLRQEVESLVIDSLTLATPTCVRTAPRTNAHYTLSHASRRRLTKSPSPLTNGSLRPNIQNARRRVETLIM